jgi:hypothetical protein
VLGPPPQAKKTQNPKNYIIAIPPTLTWSLAALFQSLDLMIELNSETVEEV